MEYLSIGEMAKVNGISPRTLRVYQQKGIIEPQYVDARTGKRYYDIRQSRTIDMVHQLQTIGLTLDEIKQIGASGSIAQLKACAQSHLDDIERRQRELAEARHAAEEIVESCKLYEGETVVRDQFFLQRLSERRILRFDIPDLLDLDPANTRTSDQWEWMLRRVKQVIQAKGYPHTLYRNVGSAVAYERVLKGDPSVSYAFVFVDESHGACFDDAEVVPAAHYLTYYGDQGYLPDGTGMCAHLMGRLLDYAAAKRMRPVGDYYEEVICRWPCMFGTEGKMLFRVCLPVEVE